MAPCHRVADRALAPRQVQGAADQQPEPVRKLVRHRGQRQVADPGGCQLDGQRQAIQLAADLRHQRGGRDVEGQVRPDRQRAFPEQRRRRPPGELRGGNVVRPGRQVQRRDRELVLAAQPQCAAAAGDQENGLRAAEHGRVHLRRRRRQVLERVQHDQHPPAREPLRQQFLQVGAGFGDSDRLGHLRHDQRGIPDLAQADEADAAAEGRSHLPGRLGGQPGLADAAGTGQRQQADGTSG
jgi:hypothetical protein